VTAFTRVGDKEIRGWADLLQAPSYLQGQVGDKLPPWLERRRVNDEDMIVAKVWFEGERDGVCQVLRLVDQLGNTITLSLEPNFGDNHVLIVDTPSLQPRSSLSRPGPGGRTALAAGQPIRESLYRPTRVTRSPNLGESPSI